MNTPPAAFHRLGTLRPPSGAGRGDGYRFPIHSNIRRPGFRPGGGPIRIQPPIRPLPPLPSGFDGWTDENGVMHGGLPPEFQTAGGLSQTGGGLQNARMLPQMRSAAMMMADPGIDDGGGTIEPGALPGTGGGNGNGLPPTSVPIPPWWNFGPPPAPPPPPLPPNPPGWVIGPDGQPTVDAPGGSGPWAPVPGQPGTVAGGGTRPPILFPGSGNQLSTRPPLPGHVIGGTYVQGNNYGSSPLGGGSYGSVGNAFGNTGSNTGAGGAGNPGIIQFGASGYGGLPMYIAGAARGGPYLTERMMLKNGMDGGGGGGSGGIDSRKIWR